MTKQYILRILENCSEHAFGQDAVEWAIMTGRIQITGDNLDADLRTIMGEPGKPETGQYDQICDDYRRVRDDLHAATMDALTNSGLLEEILRPASLANKPPNYGSNNTSIIPRPPNQWRSTA